MQGQTRDQQVRASLSALTKEKLGTGVLMVPQATTDNLTKGLKVIRNLECFLPVSKAGTNSAGGAD